MTIMLNSDQEQAVRDAIRDGQLTSVEEFINRALAALRRSGGEEPAKPSSKVFEQGLGLFGSPEDAALLDEVVAFAYEERHRPGQSEPLL
jgi:hypothetical protein